jgi:hypothetical protein
MEQRQRRLRQLHAGCVQQRPPLLECEAKIVGSELGQLGFQAQAVQAQPQIVAARKHEVKLCRRAHQEQLELAQRLRRAQLVQVVDHEPDGVVERSQIVQQPLDDHSAVESGRRRQSPHRGRGATERVDHRDPERLRVRLLVPHRDPRRTVGEAGLTEPGAEQERLPASRGRRDRNDPGRFQEPLEQRATKDDPFRTGRGPGTGCDPGTCYAMNNFPLRRSRGYLGGLDESRNHVMTTHAAEPEALAEAMKAKIAST